jgi:hypothetical protein
VDGDVLVGEGGAVDNDARASSAVGGGDAGEAVVADRESPERGGAVVAEHAVGRAREDSGHPAAVAAEGAVPDGIDAGVQAVQAPRAEFARDPRGVPRVGEQRTARDHAVLRAGNAVDADY